MAYYNVVVIQPGVGFEMFPIASNCAEAEMAALFRVPCDSSAKPEYGNYVAEFGPLQTSRQFEAVRYGLGMFISELDEVLQTASEGKLKPPFKAYLGHDATMLPMLYMLGATTSQWPPYAATMRIEVFRADDSKPSTRHFARVLYNGLPLPLAQYKSSDGTSHEVSVVPLQLLQSMMRPFAVKSPGEFCKECNSLGQ